MSSSNLNNNLFANYLSQIWTLVMGIIFVPLYISYLGMESYGLIGFYSIMIAWMGLLDIGMSQTLSREMARLHGGLHSSESIRDLLRSMEFIAFFFGILILFLVYLGSDWLSTSYLKANDLPPSKILNSITIMSFLIVLRYFEGLYRMSIIGLQKQVILGAITASMATLRSFGTIAVLVFISPSIEAFFIWQGVMHIITLLLLGLITYKNLPRIKRHATFSMIAISKVWKFTGGVMSVSFLAFILNQADKMILLNFLSLAEYGAYTLAALVAGLISLLTLPVIQAYFPKFSQLIASNDRNQLFKMFHESSQMVTVFIGSIAIIIIIYSKPLILVWTQNEELANSIYIILSLLAIGNLFNSFVSIPYQMQLAYGWTRLSVKVNIFSIIFLIPALYYLVPIYGAIGAACSWVIINLGYFIIAMHFMFKKILKSEKWKWYLEDITIPIIGPLIIAIIFKALIPFPSIIIWQLIYLLTISIAVLSAAIFSSKYPRYLLLSYLTHLMHRSR